MTVLQPEDVQVDLVALEQLIIGESFKAFALDSFMAVLGTEALDEFVEVSALQRFLFKREVLIRAQVVDPEFFSPGDKLSESEIEELAKFLDNSDDRFRSLFKKAFPEELPECANAMLAIRPIVEAYRSKHVRELNHFMKPSMSLSRAFLSVLSPIDMLLMGIK